ncbi:hypothetical protein [Massilia sp. 9096]|jgi:hypothetical protein|uniref:hypothetical protein n=1 Tax=Massilia sp. 9096 TaxID=1500894 RepID=UPI00056A3886|nr:hypothetical protein [Massilia sp. 9096]
MKIEVAVAELCSVRLALAFVDAAWVRPGPGDALIARLGPYLPPLPLMLVDAGGGVHAHFQTGVFAALAALARGGLTPFTVDLDLPPPSHEPPPF